MQYRANSPKMGFMEQRKLGNTGIIVSALGYGSAPAGYLSIEQDKFAQILNLLLDNGINLIDTAAAYPGSEEMIGNCLAHRRSQYTLVSKCGRPIAVSSGEAWSARVIHDTVDQSLARLKTDHLDVMLLHSCSLETLKCGEAMGALVKAKKEGKIRFAGCSTDNEAAAFAATLPDVSVIEISINMVDQANIQRVLPLCLKNNIGVLAKRPIAEAVWRSPTQMASFIRIYSQPYRERLAQMQLNPAELGFSQPAEEAWPEMAMRFTLNQPGVSCAIIGTTQIENAKKNIESVSRGPLPADVEKSIADAFKREAAKGGDWAART